MKCVDWQVGGRAGGFVAYSWRSAGCGCIPRGWRTRRWRRWQPPLTGTSRTSSPTRLGCTALQHTHAEYLRSFKIKATLLIKKNKKSLAFIETVSWVFWKEEEKGQARVLHQTAEFTLVFGSMAKIKINVPSSLPLKDQNVLRVSPATLQTKIFSLHSSFLAASLWKEQFKSSHWSAKTGNHKPRALSLF